MVTWTPPSRRPTPTLSRSRLINHSKPTPTAIDHREHALTFEVLDAKIHQHGLLMLPSAWHVRRNTEQGPEA